MDTKNWFGEHAASIKLIALAGGIALAAIIVLDILTHKKSSSSTTTGAAPATGLDTSPATSGTSATSTLQNPGETYINILEDYSSHVGNNSNDVTTGNSTTTNSGHFTAGQVPPVASQPVPAPAFLGGATPSVAAPGSTGGATQTVPTPHPSEQYTVKSGDSLWSIASRFLDNGADWRELYNWNRSTVGSNPNRIYPGETLNIYN